MIPTMSKAALLLECQYWAAPDLPRPPEDIDASTQYGIDFHAVIASALKAAWLTLTRGEANVVVPEIPVDAPVAAHAGVVEAYPVLMKWLTGDNPFMTDFTAAHEWKIEQALAWRVLGNDNRLSDEDYDETEPPDADHVYPLNAREPGVYHCGSADLIAIPDDEEAPLLILDHKTGHDDFSKPDTFPQLWDLAAVACKRYRRKSAILAVFHAPKPRGDDEEGDEGIEAASDVFTDIVVYASPPVSGKRLKAFRVMIRKAWRQIVPLTEYPRLRPGPWCEGMYCPAYVECPRQRNALMQLGRVKGDLSIPGAAGAAHQRLQEARATFKRLDEAIAAAVRTQIEAGGPDVRPDGQITLLREASPREKLSKASLTRMLGKVRAEAEIERLRKIGGIEVSTPKPSLVAVKDGG